MKVLLVVGNSRSGSTILGNALGSVDGFCHAGEVRWLWRRGLLESWLCGCGERVRDCPFWTAVIEAAFGGLAASRIEEVEDLRVQVYRQLSAYRGEIESPQTREYEGELGKLYRALAAVSGAEVIVDTSKTAAHGWSLSRLSGLDLQLLHLVRDSRAVAYSWSRKKALPDSPKQPYFNQRNVEQSCSIWNVTNDRAERLLERAKLRSGRLRYEDFAAFPREALNHVLSLLGEAERDLDFVAGRQARLSACHTISGNPSRFDQTGLVEIRRDEEWKLNMRREDIEQATEMTLPRLRLYGYEPVDGGDARIA